MIFSWRCWHRDRTQVPFYGATSRRWVAGWHVEGDSVCLVPESVELCARDEEPVGSHRQMWNESYTAADREAAQVIVAGFNLTGSLEESDLSVSKETLSWPPGDTQRKPQVGPWWPFYFEMQETNWVWHFCVCCVFFRVVLLPLEVPRLPVKSRAPWALCTCCRRVRASPSGTSAGSVPSKGFLPKLRALTPVRTTVLVPPHHHALGDCPTCTSGLPHSWGCLFSGT